MPTKHQTGFTLIELMIVVAIIAILAAIALPSYQNYAIRAKITEALSLAAAAKTAVAETYNSVATLPESNKAAGLPAANTIIGHDVASVAVAKEGIITVTFNGNTSALSGSLLILTPNITNAGSMTWSCKSGGNLTKTPQYLPASCR